MTEHMNEDVKRAIISRRSVRKFLPNEINKDIINSVTDFIEAQATSLVRRNRKSLFKNEDLKSEQDILQDIRYRTFIDIEDCLSEILIYRGNLSKVSQRYLPPGLKQEYQNRLYYSMDEMDEKVQNLRSRADSLGRWG